MRADLERPAEISVDCSFKLHRSLGPGLLEAAYEGCLAHDLAKRGLSVERQKMIPIIYDGAHIDAGFRTDILIEGALLIELKSTDSIAPVHIKTGSNLPPADEPAAWSADEFRRIHVQGWLSPPCQ